MREFLPEISRALMWAFPADYDAEMGVNGSFAGPAPFSLTSLTTPSFKEAGPGELQIDRQEDVSNGEQTGSDDAK